MFCRKPDAEIANRLGTPVEAWKQTHSKKAPAA